MPPLFQERHPKPAPISPLLFYSVTPPMARSKHQGHRAQNVKMCAALVGQPVGCIAEGIGVHEVFERFRKGDFP